MIQIGWEMREELQHKHTVGHCASYLGIASYSQYILIHQHTETQRCTVGYIAGPMCIVSLRSSFFPLIDPRCLNLFLLEQ